MPALEAIPVTLAALLPIVNRLGSAPIFLAHSADLPAAARQHLAWVVARNALLLLIAAMLAGAALDRPAGLITVAAYLIGAAIVAVTVFVCYRSAHRLGLILGETGRSVFLRWSAFILLCVGVAIFWSGAVGLFRQSSGEASGLRTTGHRLQATDSGSCPGRQARARSPQSVVPPGVSLASQSKRTARPAGRCPG
jgi:small neutral amino acid transporter SnatA (MarC family)